VLRPKPGLPPYLVLLRVGFALPAASLPRRCALTAPFHPYPAVVLSPFGPICRPICDSPPNPCAPIGLTTTTGRYVFCGTFRRPGLNPASRTLSGTLLYGVRTFLSRCRERPSGPAANAIIISDTSNPLRRSGKQAAACPLLHSEAAHRIWSSFCYG
jgi:hypothetical protein